MRVYPMTGRPALGPTEEQLRAVRDAREVTRVGPRTLAADSVGALIGRVTYAPLDGSRWKLTGEASLSGFVLESVFGR